MSSGAKSNQSLGVGNSQLSIENFEYSQKLLVLQLNMSNNAFTDPQKSILNTVFNTITIHLTKKDYSGVQRDIEGNPVPNGKGGFFNHIQEMKDSYKALKRSKRSLEGSLKNPNLEQIVKTTLENALKLTNQHLKQIDDLFEPYGGIEKWKKK